MTDRVDELEGAEPLEEVGPEECNPDTQACQVEPERGDPPEASQVNFSEELLEQYVPERIEMAPSEIDGLPIPLGETSTPQGVPPPFTYETVVCVGDDREYVSLFVDEAKAKTGYFSLRRYRADGSERERFRFAPERVVVRFGVELVELQQSEIDAAVNESDAEGLRRDRLPSSIFMQVRPRRPACKYYKRQVFNQDNVGEKEFGHYLTFRNCTMRRSVGGAFMSLFDQAVYACDYRDPPDPESMKRFDDKERERLRSDAHKKRPPIFGSGDPT